MIQPLRISIVTVVFNGETYLEECMDSVLRQGYPNLDYIVIDGGSADRSVDIIRKFSKHLSYWVSEKDFGMYDALNKGFKKSSGEIMAWINSDDLLMNKSLFLINDLFQRHPQAEWIQGLPLKISSDGSVFDHFEPRGSKYDYYLKRYGTNNIPFVQQESTFWKRTLWERAGGTLNTNYKIAGDFDLWMRFFELGQLYHTRGLVGGFRIHNGQLSSDKSAYFKECEQAVNEALKQAVPDVQRQITLYKRLLKLEGIPLVSRLSRRLFRNFYRTTELKYLV